MPSEQVALWKERSLRFLLGASPSLIAAVLGVIRNKWLASHLATTGLGVLAQVSSAQIWLGTAAGLGLNLPVARAVGAASAVDDAPAIRRTVGTASALAAGAALAVVALSLLLAPQLSALLLGTPEHAALVRIAALGMAGLALQGTVVGLFAGRSDVRAPVALALAGGLPGTALTLTLVPRFGLIGGVLAGALIYPLGLCGALWIHRRDYAPAFLPAPRPLVDRGEARSLLGVAFASLTLALIDQGTLLGLRSHYLRLHGVSANGLLQAALALTQLTGGLFYAYLSSYAFGKVSGAGGVEGIRLYTRRQWGPLMLLAAAVFAVAMLACTPLLHLLYSNRFDPARPMMAWALFGEYAKVGMQVWVLGALPLGGMRLLFPLAVAYPVSMAIAYGVLSRLGAGMLSLPGAYAAAGVAALSITGLVMSRRGVTIRWRDGVVLAGGLLALGALARAVAG